MCWPYEEIRFEDPPARYPRPLKTDDPSSHPQSQTPHRILSKNVPGLASPIPYRGMATNPPPATPGTPPRNQPFHNPVQPVRVVHRNDNVSPLPPVAWGWAPFGHPQPYFYSAAHHPVQFIPMQVPLAQPPPAMSNWTGPVPSGFPPPWIQAWPPGPPGPNPATGCHMGRTPAEAAWEEQRLADEAAIASREATKNWKPAAKPEDMFWAWDDEHHKRHLYSFATISSWGKDGGKWHRDPNTEIAYYVRKKS